MIDRSNSTLRLRVLLLLMTATAGTWGKKAPLSTYSEDLAVHRKKFQISQQPVKQPSQKWSKKKPVYVLPVHAVTDQLDYLLACKKLASEQIKHILGYTIQVYAGGSREAAFKARNKLYMHYPAIKPEVKYNLPNYTVRIGNFLDQLEAYTVYTAIKKRMPQAIIRPIALANTPYVFTNRPAEQSGTPSLAIPTTYKGLEQNEQEALTF